MHRPTVEIRRTIRGHEPRVPFEKIARAILPARYQLSLVVCGDDLAQRMNWEYRKKAYTPNVLSFPLEATEGEIFLNVREAEREARKYGVSLRARLVLLFAHGCLHLKGVKHGAPMERTEERIQKRFS